MTNLFVPQLSWYRNLGAVAAAVVANVIVAAVVVVVPFRRLL